MNYRRKNLSIKRDAKEIWKKEEEKSINESIEKFKSGLLFKGKKIHEIDQFKNRL